MNHRFSAFIVFLAALLVIGVLPARADDYSSVRIVRVSFVEGNVQYQYHGESWRDAIMNLPIQQGFSLRTGNGFAEVEFEEGLAIRLAYNSSVDFTELGLQDGRRVTRLTLVQGTAIVTAGLTHNDELYILAPNLNLNVPRTGRFRVDVSPGGSWVTVFNGKVDGTSPSGSISLTGHQTLHLDAGDTTAQQVVHSPAPDAFDKWVSQREQILQSAQQEADPYLKKQDNHYTAGIADLSGYGEWANIRGYGMGWQPYGIASGWSPYSSGAWSYMPVTGWNWVSSEPWGWLPYHFGGWIDDPDYGWLWIPDDFLDWQPANAYWAGMYGQVGWIPSAPPIVSPARPVRTPVHLGPGVLILATQGPNGTIKPGVRVPLTSATLVQTARISAPSAPATGAAVQSSFANTSAGTTSTLNSPVQSGPASQARASNGPVALRSPGAPATGPHVAAPNGLPSLQAPRSMPVSPMMNSAVQGRAYGGSNGNFDASRGYEGSRNAGNTGGSSGPSAPSSANNSGGGKPGGTTGGATGAAPSGGSGSSGGATGGAAGGHH
jgi:hypothetical protein